MKALLLSTVDTGPGAYRPAFQLHRDLRQRGVDARMMVQTKLSHDETVSGPVSKAEKGWSAVRPALNALPLRSYPDREIGTFSAQWLPDGLAARAARFGPDVVNVHFVGEGFLRIETVARFGVPVVWSLHDMWPFTGGCHYDDGCGRYAQSCGACPILHGARERDLSRRVWERKARAWRGLPFTAVASSRWIADCARASSLFRDARIEIIPLGLDTDQFRPLDKKAAREMLRLPPDAPLVLFGAQGGTQDPRKGFGLLQVALQTLRAAGRLPGAELVLFGAPEPARSPDLGFPAHYLGRLQDDIALALAYSAADVMVVPSLQESWGQTASEALSCGTPVVAWDATGPRDIVDHRENGYLARPYEVPDLAEGIAWVLADPERLRALSLAARRKAEQAFTLAGYAQRYLDLFTEVTGVSQD